MKVTIKDIAREAGVSVSMVTYVLNKSGCPTMERHKRILEIARRHNYVPGDVSVVGFDDADEEHNEDMGLTTCRQPVAQMAQYCVGYIGDCVRSGERPVVRQTMLPN